ncbi:MAG TPA: FixH family protein, partial [Armatimonadota bacterium]
MRRYLYLLLTLALIPGMAYAAGPITARAGKFTVEVTSQPSPPTVGENVLIFTVKDGDKPLNGAGVDVHIDMTTMPMPADTKAAPGTTDGEYGATVNFSMAGSWKVDVTVQQMAGMKMAGDGAAHFLVETGKGITAKSGVQIPWFGVLASLILLIIIGAMISWKRLSKEQQGYVAGTLTLLVVLVGTVGVVNKFRDTKTSTVIGSAVMDMDTSTAAPGTAAVTAETVADTPFQATASYTGTVVPDIEEDVYPRVMGRLVFMPFYPGDQIAAGQVVAKLDSAELAAKEAQAAFGSTGAIQGATAADADIATARAGHARSLKAVDQAQAQLSQMQAAARGAESGVKAAQSDLNTARQMAREADSAVTSAQAGIDQANEAVVQAQSDVDTA